MSVRRLQLMRAFLLACLAGAAAAICPCAWDPSASSLACGDLGLTEVPTACFDAHPGARTLNLTSNEITQLRRKDFSGNVDNLEVLLIDNNPVSMFYPDAFAELANLQEVSIQTTVFAASFHPGLFRNNPKLNKFVLGGMLVRLPLELFSPNLTAPFVFDLSRCFSNQVVPCRLLADLPEGSEVVAEVIFWAQTRADEEICKGLNVSHSYTTQCYSFTDSFVDCSNLPENMTPATAELAMEEIGNIYDYVPPYLTFPSAFHELLGEVPDDFDCLPGGVDKIWDFQKYYRNTEHVQLDTLYFDLADLHLFTSEITQSVSIRADTVVLTRQITLVYLLNISARRVVFRFPIHSYADTSVHSPSTDGDFFTLSHEFGEINGVIVETFRHGNVQVTLLGSEAKPCTSPADVTDILPESTSLTQLDLAVQCSVSLLDRDEQALTAALQISSLAEVLSAASPVGGMGQVRSRAASVRNFASSRLSKSNASEPLPVPYLSLSVYSDMVDDLAWNVQFYKDTLDKLRNKLEQQSEAMFDLSMTFEERHADLEFVYQESQTALTQAQSVFGSQENHLSNLRSHADSVYGLVFDVYAKFSEAATRYEAAFEDFKDGIRKAKESAFIRGCLGIFTTIGKCYTQKEYPNPAEIVNSIYQASDFVDEFDDMKDEMQESMLLINDLMRDVMDIISKLETLDPPEGDAGTDWAAAFPDTTQLLSAAQSQMVSRTQWDVSTRGATILLDDSDMKKVSGSRQYRASVLELAEWGKRFSEKVAALGVQHASEKADAVGQMMATSETNEDNYLSVLNQQNLVIMGLMLDFHTRARADMLAMARVLDEFCQAYRYNFFTDCTRSSRPTPADDYDAILLKLSKLQVGALDSLSSLTPPPQPFKKTFDIVESPSCNGALSSCPVSSLSSTGVATLVLSDWWGSELDFFDRVRIDTLQVFLSGASVPLDTSVILEVTQPAVFNDTFTGSIDTFTGHVTRCLVMYRQEIPDGDINDAVFLTDCSTHHFYDSYYTRSTPRGLYTVTVVSPDTNLTLLQKLQIHVEGSWMPHAKASEGEDPFAFTTEGH
ncbi:hypothetical protein C7M84_021665 [Penaeus vannamei]|uniref:Uncharacterized protein n=1 Tax=Penaeus vannamei TaxID=6689 RepID=A0A3R7MK88_PENVA|nr:hypothetical protein C7M84_021665 [Penaeus vannamei]